MGKNTGAPPPATDPEPPEPTVQSDAVVECARETAFPLKLTGTAREPFAASTARVSAVTEMPLMPVDACVTWNRASLAISRR